LRTRLKFAKKTRGIADVEAGYCDVLGNNSARADDCMIANRDRKDGGVRPNTYMITKLGWPPKLWLSSRATFAEQVVNEHGAMRNEAILPDRNQFADERVGLNATPLADDRPFLYLHKWPDEAAISNRATIQIDRLHHRDIFSESDIDDRGITDFWRPHNTVT